MRNMYAFYGPTADFYDEYPIFSILGKVRNDGKVFLDNFLKKTEKRTPGISEYSESLSGKRL